MNDLPYWEPGAKRVIGGVECICMAVTDVPLSVWVEAAGLQDKLGYYRPSNTLYALHAVGARHEGQSGWREYDDIAPVWFVSGSATPYRKMYSVMVPLHLLPPKENEFGVISP